MANLYKVNYKDRTYKVKANDHQEAANKVIKKLKDVSYKEYAKKFSSPDGGFEVSVSTDWNTGEADGIRIAPYWAGGAANNIKTSEQLLDALKQAIAYAKSIKTKLNLKDSKVCDGTITPTTKAGRDVAIYVLQSDADKNLYFSIGKTFSVKDGPFTYQKYEMNGTDPKTLLNELLKNGWHITQKTPYEMIDEAEHLEKFEVKDEYIKGPRGEFKLSEKTKKELESEGYGLHHTFEKDGKRYYVMTKNNNAVACIE